MVCSFNSFTFDHTFILFLSFLVVTATVTMAMEPLDILLTFTPNLLLPAPLPLL